MSEEIKADSEQCARIEATVTGPMSSVEEDTLAGSDAVIEATAISPLANIEEVSVVEPINKIDAAANLEIVAAVESIPEGGGAVVDMEDFIDQDEDVSVVIEKQIDTAVNVELKSEENSKETEKVLTGQVENVEDMEEEEEEEPACMTPLNNEVAKVDEKEDELEVKTEIGVEAVEQPLKDTSNVEPVLVEKATEPVTLKDTGNDEPEIVEITEEQPLKDTGIDEPETTKMAIEKLIKDTVNDEPEIEEMIIEQSLKDVEPKIVQKLIEQPPIDTSNVETPAEESCSASEVTIDANKDVPEKTVECEKVALADAFADALADGEGQKESTTPMETETVEVVPNSTENDEKLADKIVDVNEEQPAVEADLFIADDKSDDVQAIESNDMVIEIDDDDEDDVTFASDSMPKPTELVSVSVKVELPNQLTKDIKTSEQNQEDLNTVEPMEEEQSSKTVPVVPTNVNDEKIIEAMPAKQNQTKNPVDDGHNLLEETQPKETTSNATDVEEDDASGDVYYNKECLNYECLHQHKQFFRAPLFALSYFKISKKKFKPQYICSTCYDQALDMYEEFSGLLAAKQPLLLKDVVGGRQEFVEIIDSSDEEDEDQKADKAKDHKFFSEEDVKLIEAELDNSIKRVLDRVEIQNQLTWSKTILTSRLKALDAENNYIEEELRSLQKRADNMHVALYQCPKIKVRQLQPFDLNTGRPYTTIDLEISLPPMGEIQRPPIQINETYYAVKNKAIASWVPCKIMEPAESTIVAQKNTKSYKIKFLKSQYQMVKTVSVKHLAYFDPPSVRLPIGSRVIAYFDATSLSRGKEKMMIQSAFYPGIIAEPLKPNNKYRYLIFYDDGYTQYVYHKDVRLVCNVSENVWEDVHPGSRDFIQKYLTQYSINRPMVQTQKGQSMTTESNGKWIYARVVDIDCSLIQMQFEGPKSHTEWIYRGSMRLGPVFKEHQKTMQKTQMPISRLPRRTEPFIRYTEDEEATTTQQQQQKQRQIQEQQQNEPRAVAKKSVSRQESTNTSSTSTTQPVPTVRHLNNSTIYLEDENKPKGKVVYYTAKRNLPPLTFVPHTCAPSCLFKITHNLSAYSPLSKPLLSGWERMIIRQKAKKVVTYRGPCGKILRNMKELRNYLRATENVLNVENFDFNHETNCLAEYVIDSAIVQVRDISCGQEKMAIPLVNYYDNTMPPECKYAAQRIPTEGVNLNLDEEFLAGCDCEDDCSDKSKCSCWQLTYAGAKYGNPNTPIEEIGYQYKRLYEHVPTGIYECNSRCKCKSNCLNRVVQHSLEMKLQVFKTSNRGWGLRCINDIPRGSFICVYAGHLLTEDRANEGGLDVGDEYFAELDYIEVAEQIKEGYESDIESAEHEEDEEFYEQEDDDEFTPSKPLSTRSKARAQRSTRGNQPQSAEDDSQERQMINFNPNAVMDENSMRESSIRKLYGKDEACYVMDAKITGNLGRYFNHSCLPNLFVQNVLVDTHDLRFPWVAFFASTHIRAGTELTWNYNYEVGVVPGKVLYCQCGAPNCRLRLL